MKIVYALCVVICQLVLSSGQLSDDPVAGCREPTNVTQLYRNLRRNAIDTAGMAPDEPTADSIPHEATITALNDTCHHERHHNRICNCSSRQELNFDPDRIPKILVQTSCCREDERVESGWTVRCQEVYRTVKVLRRSGCIEGVFRYTTRWERVPIGCICHVIHNTFQLP